MSRKSKEPVFCSVCRRRIGPHKTSMCKKCRRLTPYGTDIEVVTQQEFELNGELWH